MTQTLDKRLDQILPRITSPEFLSSEGIGQEIACYIFDYPAAEELRVRGHIAFLEERLQSHHSDLRVLSLNLLDVAVGYLEQRKLLTRALEHHVGRGDAGVIRALEGPMSASRISEYIAESHQPAEHDLILISGIGSVWPVLRSHSLLNCLHSVVGRTPLVLFYPGTFDGTTLRLFGNIANATSTPGAKPYYRAFLLVPGGAEA